MARSDASEGLLLSPVVRPVGRVLLVSQVRLLPSNGDCCRRETVVLNGMAAAKPSLRRGSRSK